MNCPKCGYHIDDDENISYEPTAEDKAWWDWSAKTVFNWYIFGLRDWWKTKYFAGESPTLEEIPPDVLLPSIRDAIKASNEYKRQKIIEKLQAAHAAKQAEEKK